MSDQSANERSSSKYRVSRRMAARRRPALVLVPAMLAAKLLSGCGGAGYSSTTPPPVSNPTPTIGSINPTSAVVGSADFTLTVTGTSFITTSVVQWNGSPKQTSYISSTQVQAQISASDLSSAGSVNVTVLNPSPGGGTSGGAPFTINSAGVSQAISVGANGAAPNGNSHGAALNLDGHFVAFGSEATNLLSPSTLFAEAYLRGTCLGLAGCTPSTVLVSAITGTSNEGNALGGASASISSDGRLVGFSSTATNLVTPNTVSEQYFVRDTCSGQAPSCSPVTVLASVTQSGLEPHGSASDAMLASQSCHVTFVSTATDVVSGVGIAGEVYLSSCATANLAGGFTGSILVSADNSNSPANLGAQQPAISATGRFIAFASASSNLPGAPGGGAQNIYVRDTCTGAAAGCVPSTSIVSVDNNTGTAIAGSSQRPAISADGRFISFSSFIPLSGGNVGAVFLRDTCAGAGPSCMPSTLTIAEGGANTASNASSHAISADGRFVVFDSNVTNLVMPITTGNQVFVRDTCISSAGSVPMCVPQTKLISVDSKGKAVGGGAGAISGDGHFAAFENETTIFQIFLAATGI